LFKLTKVHSNILATSNGIRKLGPLAPQQISSLLSVACI
jgi:hypothetical protein